MQLLLHGLKHLSRIVFCENIHLHFLPIPDQKIPDPEIRRYLALSYTLSSIFSLIPSTSSLG